MSQTHSKIQESSLLLTGGGTETFLLFEQAVELREFCAFEIFSLEEELVQLEDNFLRPIADAALANGRDLLLDALTWRAHADYLQILGYPETGVEDINRLAVAKTRGFIKRWRDSTPGSESIAVFLNGDIGPRGDGYRLDRKMSVASALQYHRRQVEALAVAGVDVINALTMTNVAESIAIALAAQEVGLPCIVSPTVEVDGTTPEGLPLGDFIRQVEEATAGSPLYYIVNCAHPTHLEPALHRAREANEDWLHRFRGFRANASRKSHKELNESLELDRGHPVALASQMAHLQATFDLCLVGGCCGTDAEHIANIAECVAEAGKTQQAQTGYAHGQSTLRTRL